MEKKVLSAMFDNLLHIGNKSNFWNSKMKDYIYGSINGVHVINLVKTGQKLEEVKSELNRLATEGKKVLFVATKLQARDSFSKVALETGHYFVTEKWVPGLLTNFKTIKGRIATYLRLVRDSETGAFDVLTKKEKAAKVLELEKLDRAFKGLKEMKKMPDVIFVVDSIYEKQAVKEANNLNIPVFAIANTNGDDTVVSNLIPANTNSVKSLEYLSSSIAESLTGITVKRTPAQKTLVKKPMVKTVASKTVVKTAAPKKEEVKTEAPKKEEAKAPVKKEAAKKAPVKKEEAKTED